MLRLPAKDKETQCVDIREIQLKITDKPMLKRIMILGFCLLAASAAKADEKSSAIIARVDSILKGYANYEVKFTASAAMMGDVKGSYTVSGDRFSITVDDQTHFSDGKARYEIYDQLKEVVVDKADLSQRNMLSNPPRAFEFASDEFESTYKGTEVRHGNECDVIELVPLKGGYIAGTVITLYVSRADGLPAAVKYNYDGETMDIAVNNVVPLKEVDEAMFTFDRVKYGDYELIDFR